MQRKVRFQSILDNDFYKFTMQCAAVKLFPYEKARYTFINRGKHEYPQGFAQELQEAVNAMSELSLTNEEYHYFKKTCPYLSPAYLDFLKGYKYDPSEVSIVQDGTDLQVTVEGYWFRTILWEVPLLSLISELYYVTTQQERKDDAFIISNTNEKINVYKQENAKVAEFGTRRRHSYEVQDMVVKTLAANGGKSFVGSSNVHFAMKYAHKPIGTHAHEWFMFHAAKYGFKMANSISLDNWADVYRGDLGIALSDTYTNKVFFSQFDKKLAKLFDGVRHDSGDPIQFYHDVIAHYRKLGIDPRSKHIIFSDGLNSESLKEITQVADGTIGLSFGIGTNLTNDTGLRPMNIVMKLTEVSYQEDEWIHTVKLSDEKGKHTGDPKTIQLAKDILGVE